VHGKGGGNTEPVLQLRSLLTGVTVADNILIRPAGSAPGKVMAIAGRGCFFPDGVDVIDNQLVQDTHGQEGDAFIASVRNATNLRFSRNALISRYAGLTCPADHTTNQLTIAGHGRATKRGPCRLLNDAGSPPTGLTVKTNYLVTAVEADTAKLAASVDDARAGIAVALSDNGTGWRRLDVKITAALSFVTTARDVVEVELSDNRVIGDAGGGALVAGFAIGGAHGFDIKSRCGQPVLRLRHALQAVALRWCEVLHTPVIAFTPGGKLRWGHWGLSSVGAVQISAATRASWSASWGTAIRRTS
jgi:hypothetical protein